MINISRKQLNLGDMMLNSISSSKYPEIDPLPRSNEEGPIQKLPFDVLSEIFENVILNSAACVCKDWVEATKPVAFQLKKLAEDHSTAFGLDQWAKHMDKKVTPAEIKAAYDMLPKNIEQILKSPCPVFPESGKTVGETHLPVFIPQSVDGESFTLTSLGELKSYRYINPEVREKLDIPVGEAHWVLMTKDVLGGEDMGINGSRGKDFATQKGMVDELANRSGEAYMVPRVLEAVAVIIAHLLKSGEYIFCQGDLWTFTRSEEMLSNGHQVSVGGFAPSGLYVYSSSGSGTHGVAGLRKFF